MLMSPESVFSQQCGFCLFMYMCVWSFNSEFCGENLSRHRFTRAVKKLNANILHLCFSQVGEMHIGIL